jgi:hypothetical protein
MELTPWEAAAGLSAPRSPILTPLFFGQWFLVLPVFFSDYVADLTPEELLLKKRANG